MPDILKHGAIIGLAAISLAGCNNKPDQLFVDHAWVRLAAVQGRPAAAYFTVHGGPAAHTLINVSTDIAIRSEMHQTEVDGTTSSMVPISNVSIPAETAVEFKPGAMHVMLSNVNPGIKPGGSITLTFTFANGERILRNANVIAAGVDAPA